MLYNLSNEFNNLLTATANKTLPCCLLFCSSDKENNKIFIDEFLQYFFCKNGSACNACEGCIKTTSGSNPDVLIFPKGNSFQVSDADEIINSAFLAPMIFDEKIIYIKDLDNSTESAQNKILKILEDTPKNVRFILSTTNKSKLLQTIISRCNIVNVPELNFNQVKSCFKNQSEETLLFAYNLFGGNLGKIKSFLDSKNFNEANLLANNIVNDLKSSKEIIFYSSKISKSKELFLEVLQLLDDKFRNLFNKNILSNLCIVEIIKQINLAKEEVENNVLINVLADNLLMKILEVKFLYK